MRNCFKLTNLFKSCLSAVLLSCFVSVGAQEKTVTEITFDHDAHKETFAFGADISWLSQQESWGNYYCNRAGKRADLMDILKDDFGINALRFRVWVNPSGGWSGKKDVIGLCKRAHQRGFKIMISFHYSDTWADSQNQTIPAQWTDHSAEALEKNVYDHTKDVLTGLKNEGIIPKWVSIGNETKYGMLYETGRTKTTEGIKNFCRFINAGYKAVKEIDPDIITIIHLSNGHDEATARKMFDNLDKYGANYDCIGLSTYPKWSHLDISTDANIKSTINTYLTVFKNLKARFNKPVMAMETGHYVDKPYEANRFFAEYLKALIADKDLGCFFWEPEAADNSGYNLGAWNSKTRQGTIALDAFKGIKHTEVKNYASAVWMSMDDSQILPAWAKPELRVLAKTPTTVTSVSKVEFYMDQEIYSSVDNEGKTTIYSTQTENIAPGAHVFHALVHDNQGHIESSDTVHLLMDDVAVFQEDSKAFIGVTDGEMTVEKKLGRYTGEGYFPAADKRATMLNYSFYFPEVGKYKLYIRYHSDDKCSMMLKFNGKSSSMGGLKSPVGRWGYLAKVIEIEKPGTYPLSIRGVTKGFPDIDFVAIASPEGVEKVTEGEDVTSIFDIESSYTGDDTLYDLKGIAHSEAMSIPSGIYIKNGKKIIIK